MACEAYFAKSEAKIFDSETKLAFEQQRISKRPVLAILALKTDPCFARRAQAISPQSLARVAYFPVRVASAERL